jgi:hypothetical protein
MKNFTDILKNWLCSERTENAFAPVYPSSIRGTDNQGYCPGIR